MIEIKNKKKLEELIKKIKNNEPFSEKFCFKPYELRKDLFQQLNINIDRFEKKWIYFNKKNNLHISESQHNYILISTVGFAICSYELKTEKEKWFDAFQSQYEIMTIIMEKVKKIMKKKDVYDVDSFNHEYINRLKAGLFHNYIFYIELLAKTYLILSGETISHTHKIEKILEKVLKNMYLKKHNNTIFHRDIIPEIEKTLKHLKQMPAGFKEEFIKYNDNNGDDTILLVKNLDQLIEFLNNSDEIIADFYFSEEKSFYFKDDLYNKILKKAEDENEKQKIEQNYKYLIN